MPVKGTYLLMAGGGGLLLYSGLRGKNFSSALRDLISGKSPSGSQSANPISTVTPPLSSATSAISSALISGSQLSGGISSGSAMKNQLLARTLAAARDEKVSPNGQLTVHG